MEVIILFYSDNSINGKFETTVQFIEKSLASIRGYL